MKTIFKRKNGLYFLATLLIAAFLFIVGGFLLCEKPRIAASAATPSEIEFESGASARIDETGDSSGLRFTANLTNDLYASLTENGALKENAVLGMIIVPQSYVDAYEKAGETNYLEFFVTKKGIAQSKIAIDFTANMLDKTATGYQMRGALVNIYPQNYERDFRAIAYYSLNNNPNDTTFASYQYFTSKDKRNVAQVAISAIQNEGTDKPEGYTEKALNVLYTYTNGAIPRVLYDASKDNHLELLEVKGNNAQISQENNKFKATKLTTDRLVITPTFLDSANLEAYKGGNIFFTVKVNIDGVECSVGTTTVTLTKDAEVTISVPVDSYLENKFFISFDNLSGDVEVLISDISICAKHDFDSWSYSETQSGHYGKCRICNKMISGECTGEATYVSNGDKETHTVKTVCSVCNNVIDSNEAALCTFVNGECVCSQAIWERYAFGILDSNATLHIFNRRLEENPVTQTTLSFTLKDGNKLEGNLSALNTTRVPSEGYLTLFNERGGTPLSGELTKNWGNVATYVKKVVVEDSFAPAAAKELFQNFKQCTTMDLSKLDTSEVTDMSSMFSGCSGLTSLDVSNFDTSKVTDMTSMFNGCKKLTALDVSNFNTSNVKTMNRMFYGCSGLTSLNVSEFDTASVTDMSYMFNECSVLTSLNVSEFNTASVTDMSYMFYSCKKLTALDVSNFNTSNVKTMNRMFYGCSGLISLNVSEFNTEKVTSMSSMFYGCSGLTSLGVSKFNTASVMDMYSMFYGCSGLTSLDVSKFNTASVTDMRYMFSGCSGLTSLDASNFDTSKVTKMSYMFNGCSGLEKLAVSNFDTSKVTTMSFMFYNCSKLTALDVSNFDTAKVTGMDSMFYGCSSVKVLDVSGFNTATVTNMGSMFYGCSSVKVLDVSDFNTANVTNMGMMFYNCSNVTKLDLSNFSAKKVKGGSSIDGVESMFYGCSKVEEIVFGENFTVESANNLNDMFNGCGSLKTLDLSGFNTANVTNMDDVFRGCSSLTELKLSNWNTANVTTMWSMFEGCSSLTTLDLSSFNTAKVGYMCSTFKGCELLETIYVGTDWSIARVDSVNDTFLECTSLKGAISYDSNKTTADYATTDYYLTLKA